MLVSFEARPRLIGNEIWGNVRAGIVIARGGDPHISGNTIRDHSGVHALGVIVDHTSLGLATILPDNVFLRNGGGDVLRLPAPAPAPVVNGASGGAGPAGEGGREGAADSVTLFDCSLNDVM